MTTTTQKVQDNPAEAHPDLMTEPVAAAPKAEGKGGRGKAPSAFRTISEVADDLRVPQHVLRFWETKFSQVKPLKRGGGRRYYRPEDVALLKKIHHLLYTEGYTIKGVQKLLKGPSAKPEASSAAPAAQPAKPAPAAPAASAPAPVAPSAAVSSRQAPSAATPRAGLSSKQRAILESMLGELQDLREIIRGGRDER